MLAPGLLVAAAFLGLLGLAALAGGRGALVLVWAALFCLTWSEAWLNAFLITAIAVLALLMQLVVPLVVDFATSVVMIPVGKRWPILRRMTMLSVPILLAAAVGWWVTSHFQNYAIQKIVYTHETTEYWGCQDGGSQLVVCRGKQGMQADLDDTIHRIVQKSRGRLIAAVDASVGSGHTEATTVADKLEQALFLDSKAIIPKKLPGLNYREKACSLSDWIKDTKRCLERIVKKPVADAYEDMRSTVKSGFEQRKAEALATGDRSGVWLKARTRQFVTTELSAFEAKLRQLNAQLFWLAWLLKLIGFGLLLVALTKAVFYIFARLLYDPAWGEAKIRFLKARQDDSKGIVITDATRNDSEGALTGFRIPLNGETWYSWPGGPVIHDRRGDYTSIPQFLSQTFWRLWFGRVFFYCFADSSEEMGGHGEHDLRFTLIEIPRDKRLVLRLDALQGFTKGIRLRTIFDVRLAMLMRHRFCLRVAEGPGKILLCSRGGAVAAMLPWEQEGSRVRAAHPEDIIAFDLDADFVLDVRQDFSSVYVDSHSFMLASPHAALYVPRSSSRRKYTSLFRRLGYFLRPI